MHGNFNSEVFFWQKCVNSKMDTRMGEYDYSQIILLLLHYYYYIIIIIIILLSFTVCIGNYTVREVLMKNRTRVWRNVYHTASA